MKEDTTTLKQLAWKRSFWGTRHGFPEVVATFFLIVIAIIVLAPFILPLFFAFKTQLDYNVNPYGLPETIELSNFSDAWEALNIPLGLLNTLIVCIGAICATIPAAALAGYVFARYKTKVTEIFFYLIIIGYFIPAQMVLIPLYRLNTALGLFDSFWGIFLPMGAFGIPMWMVIYRSFFRNLPGDLVDASRIDGAGHFGTFAFIMFPLAMPATVLALLLVFMGAWNDFLLSLIMLNNYDLFTMQLRVASFLSSYGVNRTPAYSAAALIALAPTLIMYIFGNKWIIQGTISGALKE